MKFIIKLFPEITIKSKPVRKRFITQLRRNIKAVLNNAQIDAIVQGVWDNIEVTTENNDAAVCDDILEVLTRIPGIAKVLAVDALPLVDFDGVYQATLQHYAHQLKGKYFSVRVKRAGRHDFTSLDMEKYVGGGLRQNTEAAGVRLTNPDIEVKIEIKQDKVFIVRETRKGLGGFPLGTQDAVLSLISGGFDSNVSSYLMMKRGLLTHFCFFNLGGNAHEVGVKQVAHYLWNKFGSSHHVSFVTIPFEDVVGEILKNVDNAYMGVILKRMMLRAASKVGQDIKKVEALVTGEAVAQVSSQTLRNLSVIDSATPSLVLRPLVTWDKQDIIDTCRAIGTHDFAASMPEFCGVISVNPTVKAEPHKVEAEEANFDFAVLDAAIATARIQRVADVLETQQGLMDVTLVEIPAASDVIIDVRAPAEEEAKPLQLTHNTVLKIPFYELGKRIKELPDDKTYLLYCEKGTMSQLHAQQMTQDGRTNIRVYKPGSSK